MKTTQGRRDVMKRSSLLFEGGKGKILTKKRVLRIKQEE